MEMQQETPLPRMEMPPQQQPHLSADGRTIQAHAMVDLNAMELVGEPLDERTERHMRGACFGNCGWILCWLFVYVCLIGGSVSAASDDLKLPVFITWLCTLGGGVLVTSGTYFCMGKPKGVSFGLMAEFFWWGGIGGVLIAIVGEMFTQSFFAVSSPGCNTSSQEQPSHGVGCQAFLFLQWVMIPGFWEEMFKAIWVLLRFKRFARWSLPEEDECGERTLTESVPRTTCFLFDSSICTFWWRLAKTPEAVFLSAMAAGAGFESIENIEYMFPVFKQVRTSQDARQAIFLNAFRGALSSHVLWTGAIGIRLAQRQFSPKNEKPSWALTLLPSMLIHGMWDFMAFTNALPMIIWIPLLLIISICMIVIPIKHGALKPHEGLVAEDAEAARRRPAAPQAQPFQFTVPTSAAAGEEVTVQLPDGRMLAITIPQGAGPGQEMQIVY